MKKLFVFILCLCLIPIYSFADYMSVLIYDMKMEKRNGTVLAMRDAFIDWTEGESSTFSSTCPSGYVLDHVTVGTINFPASTSVTIAHDDFSGSDLVIRFWYKDAPVQNEPEENNNENNNENGNENQNDNQNNNPNENNSNNNINDLNDSNNNNNDSNSDSNNNNDLNSDSDNNNNNDVNNNNDNNDEQNGEGNQNNNQDNESNNNEPNGESNNNDLNNNDNNVNDNQNNDDIVNNNQDNNENNNQDNNQNDNINNDSQSNENIDNNSNSQENNVNNKNIPLEQPSESKNDNKPIDEESKEETKQEEKQIEQNTNDNKHEEIHVEDKEKEQITDAPSVNDKPVQEDKPVEDKEIEVQEEQVKVQEEAPQAVEAVKEEQDIIYYPLIEDDTSITIAPSIPVVNTENTLPVITVDKKEPSTNEIANVQEEKPSKSNKKVLEKYTITFEYMDTNMNRLCDPTEAIVKETFPAFYEAKPIEGYVLILRPETYFGYPSGDQTVYFYYIQEDELREGQKDLLLPFEKDYFKILRKKVKRR